MSLKHVSPEIYHYRTDSQDRVHQDSKMSKHQFLVHLLVDLSICSFCLFVSFHSICMGVLSAMYICELCVYLVPTEARKRHQINLEPELKIVVNCYVGIES